MENNYQKPSKKEDLLNNLLNQVSDPVHKRIIEAYKGNKTVSDMEAELGKILTEIIKP